MDSAEFPSQPAGCDHQAAAPQRLEALRRRLEATLRRLNTEIPAIPAPPDRTDCTAAIQKTVMRIRQQILEQTDLAGRAQAGQQPHSTQLLTD